MKPDQLRRFAAEFAVIVLGVSAALAGEALVGRARDRAAASEYTLRLLEELEEEVASLRARQDFLERSYEAGIRVSADLESTESAQVPEQFVRDAFQVAQLWPLTLQRSTWQDLVATGRLGLLPSDLRQMLLAYHRVVETRQALEAGLPVGFRDRVGRALPVSVQTRLADCVVYGDRPVDKDCSESPIPNAESLARRISQDAASSGDLNLLLPRLETISGLSDAAAHNGEGVVAALRAFAGVSS